MSGSIILWIIAIYFGLLLLIAWITGRKSSGNEAFFIGNHSSPWYIVSIGMIGTSLSGVTFVSVPGMVRSIDMTYMQTVLGFFVGYVLIARILLPLYYKLRLTSIYTYLRDRIGPRGYKTGASDIAALCIRRVAYSLCPHCRAEYLLGVALYVQERCEDNYLD